MAKTKEREGQVVPRTTRDLYPFEEMDHLFDHLLDSGFMRPFDWRWPDLSGFRRLEEHLPRVDMLERENELLVRAEIPGVKKDDLDVTLSHDLLTIKAKTQEKKQETGEWFRTEIRHGNFTRSLRLPVEVVADKATANFKDGILEITIPKAAEAKRHTVKLM